MMKVPLSRKEANRIAVLERYGILDTPPDAVLDSFTQAAADLCEAPIALISLVDTTRQWFKSCIGLSVRETPRDIAFCSHAILEPSELMEVEDAREDERFRENPLVTGDPYIRFYAGKPLVTPDGFALGTLCVIDDKPRRLSPSQRDGLDRLANAVITLFHKQRESRIETIDHIVEHAVQHGVLITDANHPDNPITYVNQAFESLTGYAKAEILGRNCRLLQGPNTNPDSVTQLRNAIAEHRSCTLTLINYRKDGSEFWNDLTVSPVKDSAGNTVSFVGIQQNVTDQCLARDSYRRSSESSPGQDQACATRDRLAQFVEESGNEIYMSDADSFQILYVNQAACKNLGYSVEESQQLMLWDFIEGLTQEKLNTLITPLRAGVLNVQVYETDHKRKDGSTYPVSIQLQFMATQQPPVLSAIVQEITGHYIS